MEKELQKLSQNNFNKNLNQLDNLEIYKLLSDFSNEKLLNIKTQNNEDKKLYYVSAEFLVGKLLKNNLANLGIREELKQILAMNGKNIEEVEKMEPEPSLGNGGLGRLAACFLDSIANLGLNAEGIGICYHLGLFKQVFEDNKQKETKDAWLQNSKALIKTDTTYKIDFKDLSVKATMYDLPISGTKNTKSTIHLFDIDTVDENIVENGINFDKKNIEKNLTLFLYPDDSDVDGRKLRIYQQYFMVSCGARYILEQYKKSNHSFENFGDYIRFQINDTHPTMIIPELIRLMTNEGVDFEIAVREVTKAAAYTNHTILSEALEKWQYEMLADVVPSIMPIIEKLDTIIKEKFTNSNLYIIDENKTVHMANIAIHFSNNVNGVAKLHTEILKKETLKDFYNIYPEKFTNVTNGISFKRFLHNSNEDLTTFITSLIGDEFKKEPSQLEKLLAFQNNDDVLNKILEIKNKNKEELCKYIKEKEGVDLDKNSIFDVQIKRLHEYKRQQMNVLYVIDTYLKIKKGIYPKHPITVIFAAKAAPAYVMAKNIIHLIICLEKLINNDNEANKYLKIIMLENYNVTYAEKIIPASDISEQISLASKEASGTGNMKMMLNGAITLGTMDGANVEIAELVGKDNIYIFGKSSDEVINLYETNSYSSKAIYENNINIKEAVDFIMNENLLSIGDINMLGALHYDLINKDYFMALLDLENYIKVKNQLIEDYTDKKNFARKAINNIAKAGFFCADRSIEDYNRDIWKLR